MSGDPRDLLRTYLRQRGELGERELVLEGLTADELRGLYARRPAVPRPFPEMQLPMLPSPDAPARGAGADEIVRLPTLDAVREVALGCPRCRLAETRQHVVFGEGNPDADVLVVGEAPGAEEDRTGRPFVGRAGRLLNLLLGSVGLAREEVYICNVLKCRPPGNRNPQADEVEACSPYLLRQVELVKPRVVAAFGTFAAQTLLGTTTPIGKLRGRTHEYRGIPLVPTYHPAALLRTPAWVRPTWEDLQRVRAVLDRG
ncbi:MAG TPA: uracil-DNA glycosylase [Longimicrobiaceae bacterium]|nr:uracil-DNA glycosylase [Longimicrobiaceae bacterium]